MSDVNATLSARRPLVWIVDDSPTEARMTERALGERYAFEYFDDGTAVVERLGSGAPQPDVLLLDWVMPGMSGEDVCRFLRRHPSTVELPIIIVTASRIETADIVHGLAFGANDYVARPFVPEELRARIDAAVRAKQLRDAATRERGRLATVAELGRALVETGHDLLRTLETFAAVMTRELCDGCAIRMLPGVLRGGSVWRQRGVADAPELARIANLADPVVRAFESDDEALALPAAYHGYVRRFGLRGLAILPFPRHSTVQAAVTVTRQARPFDAEDVETIETCIEYAALAVENALRFEAERTARAHLDDILANLPLGILVARRDGRITFRNAVARALVNGAEVVDQLDRVAATANGSGGGPSPLATAIGRGMAGEAVLGVEVEVRSPHTEPRFVRVSVVPLRDHAEAVELAVVVLEDVTAARAIVAERERIAQFQEHMVAIVGHDIRSPLQAIAMAAHLLEDTAGGDPAALRLIQRIDAGTRRVGRIVDQLLDVTRARMGGGIPVRVRPTDLAAVARGIVDEICAAHPARRVELRTPADPVTGTWDPDRLGQVVANLVGNAIQHGSADAPVTVEVARADAGAVLEVTNQVSGGPIPAATLAMIFDPFRRGRGSRHDGGLGLGLFIAHEIVRAHGGTITAASTEAGTTFRVELPIPARPAEAGARPG